MISRNSDVSVTISNDVSIPKKRRTRSIAGIISSDAGSARSRPNSQEMPGRSQGNWESINNRSEIEQQGGPSNALEVLADAADMSEEEHQEIEYLNGILSKMKCDSLSGKRKSGTGQADIVLLVSRVRSDLSKIHYSASSKALAERIGSLYTWLLEKGEPNNSARSVLNEILQESKKKDSKKVIQRLKEHIDTNYMN